MTEINELLTQGRELFEATTPGEWDWNDEFDLMSDADSIFIAWAHNNFSALADAAERAERELKVLRDDCAYAATNTTITDDNLRSDLEKMSRGEKPSFWGEEWN